MIADSQHSGFEDLPPEALLTRTQSEIEDDEEELEVELPLSYSKNRNFVDLESEATPGKRVRFLDEGARTDVEKLLECASAENFSFAETLEKVSSLNSDTFRSRSDSASNFDLDEFMSEMSSEPPSSRDLDLDPEPEFDITNSDDDTIVELEIIRIPPGSSYGLELPKLLQPFGSGSGNCIDDDNARTQYLQFIKTLVSLGNDTESVDTNLKPFAMNELPSVSLDAFLERIQNKCMFGAVIYAGATYLLQILLLEGEPAHLRAEVTPCHTHRLVISSLRLAAKLTEDFVHSHHYYAKVVGVSGRLVARLERSLLRLLQVRELCITEKRLLASRGFTEAFLRDQACAAST